MKKVILHGKLGKRFGEVHSIEVSTPAESVAALNTLYPGFRKYLIDVAQEGVVYGIKTEKGKFVDCEYYNLKNKSNTFHFAPIPQGGGFLAVLITAAVTTYIGLWLQDIFKVEPPRPGDVLETESYIYRGPTSVQRQGVVIPVGYGRLRVGPVIVSDDVLNYDYDLERGAIMGFGVTSEGLTSNPLPFHGSSNYRFTLVKDDTDPGSQGNYLYTPGSGPRPTSWADGDKGFDGGLGPYIDSSTDTHYGTYSDASPEKASTNACVTQTFPLKLDGTVETRRDGGESIKDRPVAVMLDTSRKFRATNLEGDEVVVGPRYIDGERDKGMGWTALSSTSIKKQIGVICEGPIEGLVDHNGRAVEYDHKSPPNKDTDYLKGVYINNVAVKDTNTNAFNVSKIDFDLTSSQNQVTTPGICCDEGSSNKYMVGSKSQRLLRPEYLYCGITYGKTAILWGPRRDTTPEEREEFFLSHTVTNPNVEYVIVSIQVDELYYIYEGDEIRVTIKLGSLLGALIGAILAWIYVDEANGDATLAVVFGGMAGGLTAAAAGALAIPVGGKVVAGGLGTAAKFATDGAVANTAATFLSMAATILSGALIGAIIGNNLKLYSGRKIENSGETWPNKLEFTIKVSNQGTVWSSSSLQEYETKIKVHGVASEPYVKDFVIPLPADNPNKADRMIKVYRTTRQKNSVREGETAARYRESASLHAITEVIPIKQNYPNTVVAAMRLNARDFPDQNSNLSLDLKLKKIRVPSNYCIDERRYEDTWNGLFHGEETFGADIEEKYLKWTDNPAWVFYDLVVNDIYGLGKFGITADNIDRWALYKIAKFCDELVPSGFSSKYARRSFATLATEVEPDNIIRITESMTDKEFRIEFFGMPPSIFETKPNASTNLNVGKKMAVFYKDGTGDSLTILSADVASRRITLSAPLRHFDGMAAVEYQYELLEPRFSCNMLINSASDAHGLLKDIANIFRAMPYWAEGAIFLAQEQKEDAIMLFNNNNVGEDGFAYSSSPRSQRYNVCTVNYIDKNNSFQPRVAFAENRAGVVRDELREVRVNGLGITSKGQAKRKAIYTVKSAQLDNEVVQFSTDVIGSYLRPGDVVKVSDTNRTIAKCEGKVVEHDGGTFGAPQVTVDYPVKQEVLPSDTSTWLPISLYAPSPNLVLDDLKSRERITDAALERMRASQIDSFYITGITNNSRTLHLLYNPYTFVSGLFSFYQAVEHAENNGSFVAEIKSQTEQDLLSLTLPSGSNAWLGGRAIENPAPDFVWWSEEEAFTYTNWYGGGAPTPNYSDKVIFTKATGEGGGADFGTWGITSGTDAGNYISQNYSLSELKLAEGSSYIIESEKNLAKAEEYRVVNIRENNPGVYVVDGIKYNASKYENIEKNFSISLPEKPSIYFESAADPSSVSAGYNSTTRTFTTSFPVVTGALLYKIDVYKDDALFRSFTTPNDDSLSTINYSFRQNLSPGDYYSRVFSLMS